jgi:hypothetical protein
MPIKDTLILVIKGGMVQDVLGNKDLSKTLNLYVIDQDIWDEDSVELPDCAGKGYVMNMDIQDNVDETSFKEYKSICEEHTSKEQT